MTVKVVGRDEGAKRRITCNHCGAVLEFYKIDIKHQDMGDGVGSSYIRCPACKHMVYVKEK